MATRTADKKRQGKDQGTVTPKSSVYPSFSAFPSLSIGGSQYQDGRPVVHRVGIGKIADEFHRLQKKIQEQMDSLLEKVLDWVASQNSKIAGFGAGWHIQEYSVANDLPVIRAMFVIVQSNQDTVDESLWLDIARLDVQISQLPEFSNIRVNFTPLPFMEQEKIIAYLQLKFGR